MKNTMLLSLLLSATLSLTAFAGDPQKSGWMTNAKEELKGAVKKQVANLEVNVSAKIFSQDIMDGINASMKYVYQLEPSYKAGYYTRVDRWKLNAEIKAGDLIQDVAGSSLPVYLNINSGDEIVFIRHFKSQWVATREIPYTPLNLPLTAKRAKEHMKPGDFVAIPTELNIMMGASYGLPIITPAYLTASVNTGANYLVSSHFQLQIMKMADEKVKVKLIAMRRNGSSVGVGASWGIRVFELPGIKDLDLNVSDHMQTGNDKVDDVIEDVLENKPKQKIENKINGLFERDLVSLGASLNSGKLFEIDYVFDLNDEEAAAAYTELLSSTYRFKKLALFKTFLSDEFGAERDTNRILVTDLDMIEEIVQQDKDKDPSERRISRLFKGQNDFKGFGRNWKFGAAFYKVYGGSSSHEDLISYFNLDNERNNVLYISNSKNRGAGFFLNLLKKEQNWNNFILLKTDERGEVLPQGLTDIGSSYSLTDKMLTSGEQKYFQHKMLMNLPSVIYRGIPWSKIMTFNESQKNANISFQLLFDHRILGVFQGMSHQDILDKLSVFDGKENLISDKEKEELATTLEDCFISVDKGLEDSRVKVEKFMKLQRTSLFMKYGARLFFSFLNDEQISQLVYFSMNWSSTEVPTTNFTFGSNPSSELFPVFQRMQFLIDQGHFNLKMVEFDPDLVRQ